MLTQTMLPSPIGLLCNVQELGWSAEESFMSPPAVGPNTAVRLLAVADLGQAEVDGCVRCWGRLLRLRVWA